MENRKKKDLSKEEMAKFCQKCYTCEQGVENTVTLEELKKQRAETCKKCYFCETEVDKSISVDNGVIETTAPVSEPQQELSLEDKAKFCQKCYTCEKGVDPSMTAEEREKQRVERCRKCYTCEQDVQGRVVETSQTGDKAKQCKKCYTCEWNVSKEFTADNMKKAQWEDVPITYFLFPTNGCNLRCKYCYANNRPGKMTKETMHQTLRWLFEIDPHKNISCHYFGGEPMLMWDMVVDMVKIGTEMAKANGKTVSWGMTTNGTLLDEDRLQWIANNMRKGNPFLLSIDGRPETHDRNRVLAGGKPTHHLIPVDRIVELFPNLEVRPTIRPETAKDWFKDYCWLRNKGFKHIAVEADFECEWTAKQMDDYEAMLRQLGKYYIYAYQLGKPIYMKFIDGVRNTMYRTTPPGDRMCGVGWNSAGIDHRGNLYACQRYTAYNDPAKYALGDIWSGWDEFKLFETQLLFRNKVRGDITKGYDCQTCPIRNSCFKGCNAANCKWTGKREISLPTYCELGMREYRVALSVLAELNMLTLRPEATEVKR
jgi:uncharacterized protein